MMIKKLVSFIILMGFVLQATGLPYQTNNKKTLAVESIFTKSSL